MLFLSSTYTVKNTLLLLNKNTKKLIINEIRFIFYNIHRLYIYTKLKDQTKPDVDNFMDQTWHHY